MKVVTDYESKYLSGRAKLPKITPGMQVRVHQKITEGKKERVQIFEGLVIKTQGEGANYHITVRKIASGVGVEKIFPLHSPVIEKIEVVGKFKVRRADLRHVRTMTKADRLKDDKAGLKKYQDALAAAETTLQQETEATKAEADKADKATADSAETPSEKK